MNKLYISEVNTLLNECKLLADNKKRAVIAIDGRAASGKSTLADIIAEHIGGCVVRTDDFFLPVDMRTSERLNTPGGNIHHERFTAEVVDRLVGNFDYGVFSCTECKIINTKHIDGDCPIIVEGAYSASPVFKKYYDLLVFVTASYDVRVERIVKRNGTEKAKIFEERWIPLEEVYFSAFGIEEKADIVMNTSEM